MNTIEHDGNKYEVLSLDRISEITHARLAGGKVVEAEEDRYCVTTQSPSDYAETRFGFSELTEFGIQPLRLVPREPVTFECEVVLGTFHGCDMNVILTPNVPLGMKFQLTQIVEEA